MSRVDTPRISRSTLTVVLVVASTLLAAVVRLPGPGSGTTEPAVLLASTLAGAISVTLMALIAARLAGPWAAAVAGLLGALSPIHTLASRQATPEVAVVLLASLSLWLTLCVEADGGVGLAGAHGLLMGLLASGSAALLGLAILQLAWLTAQPDRRSKAALSIGVAGSVVVLAGALGLLRSPLSEGADVLWAPSTTLLGMVRCTGSSFTRLAGFEYQLAVSRSLYLTPLTLLVVALALLGGRRLPARPRWLLLGGVTVPFALGALLAPLTGRVTPLQAERMIAALPSLLALLGVGLASVRGWRLAAVFGLVVGATVFFLFLALFPPPG